MHRTPAPQNRRAAITSDELRDLYLTQRLTIEQVGAKLGVASTTISRRMRDLGIDARRREPRPGTHSGDPASTRRCPQWNADLAYAVGLITTDGCLGRDGRHLSLTSKDVDLLETAARCLGVKARITLSTNPRPVYRLQWGDVLFHRWLVEVGLTPAKSHTLGPLAVPDEYFVHFFRGCIDGDGSIVTYVDRSNMAKNSAYVYTRLFVSIVSASERFPTWLRTTVRRLVGVSGHLTLKRSADRSDIWCLRYAKRESLALLRWIYAPGGPSLRRKQRIAAAFLPRRDPPPRRGPGRPMVG